MPDIQLLTQDTIDKIAAGEVVERPASVVKELVENALDAGASAVTVEIKEGGISFIRITDNGCGIQREQVPLAFLRHSTSKIRSIEDLMCVSSLGFRGEALSSISAVSRVELITKTPEELTGTRYVIEGSKEQENEEIGAPEGTTFLVRDLFYNTPARRKFLKTAATEGNYIYDIIEKLALSHPEVSFKYIQNNQTKLHSSGNGNVKDLIYHIYGREIAASLIPVELSNEYFDVTGFIGKPVITRGNRNFENYYINGRYIKSNLLAKAIEDAYKKYIMQHQYPFTVLYFNFKGDIDVNVHPTKMEMRFGNNQEVYTALTNGLFELLAHRDMIPVVPIDNKKHTEAVYQEPIPEPFEQKRLNDLRRAVAKDSPYEVKYPQRQRPTMPEKQSGQGALSKSIPAVSRENSKSVSAGKEEKLQVVSLKRSSSSIGEKTGLSQENLPFSAGEGQKGNYDPMSFMGIDAFFEKRSQMNSVGEKTLYAGKDVGTKLQQSECNVDGTTPVQTDIPQESEPLSEARQQTLEEYSADFMTKDARKKHRIIGQLFKTYWLVEYEEQLYIIDQHAAHEKVLYERTMKKLADKEFTSQTISPPLVMTLDAKEMEMLEKYRSQIERIGYEVEHFGGKEYMITAVPDNLFHIDMKDLFIEMLDDFTNITGRDTPDLVLEKVASMSCKAAVKGNDALSLAEAEALFDELLELENPYNCPHGRPTIISMTKYEIEKKFKRIV